MKQKGIKTSYHHGDLKRALIEAGTGLLASGGPAAFSLRKVAELAGVSHAAPYAHFKDKPELIAAIVAEGFGSLLVCLSEAALAALAKPGRPSALDKADERARLLALAEAYLAFAYERPDLFRIMFSGILEKEKDYPELAAVIERCYGLLVQTVQDGQASGFLPPEPVDMAATRIWSALHGLATLALNRQIPSAVLAATPRRVLIEAVLLPPAQR